MRTAMAASVLGLMAALVMAADRPAALEPRLAGQAVPAGAPLRLLTVEERVGQARTRELVRVPLFFHEGECADVNALAITPVEEPAGPVIAYQADDVRRDAQGRLSRMHLYFLVDLRPWERKQFAVRAGRNPGADLAPVAVEKQGDQVTLAGQDLRVTFRAEGKSAGAITAIQSTAGRIDIGGGGLSPRMKLVRQGADCKTLRSTAIDWEKPETIEIRDVRHASGPLFATFSVHAGPPNVPDGVRLTYLLPRHGNVLTQTEMLFPEEPETAEVVGATDHVLLSGQVTLGGGAGSVAKVPAGLRELTRSIHGHFNDALVNPAGKLSLFPVPCVQTGMGGISAAPDGRVAFMGTPHFKRTAAANSGTLRAFWGEVRYVISGAVTEEQLWDAGRRHFQPLVAIVDEPGVSVEMLRAMMPVVADRFFEIKYWGRGWVQTAAMLHLKRDQASLKKLLEKSPQERELSADYYLPAWARAGQPQRTGGKPDVGRLDPYGISYGQSGIVAFAKQLAPSARMDQACLVIGQSSRKINARAEKNGFPYINCFATALNMQIGTCLIGLHGASRAGDADLARFCRDVVRTPAIGGIYGHGQRTYTGNITGPGASDLLYESTSDFHLRAMELYMDEDLSLHPAVFGRYLDCVDVSADLYHRALPDAKRPSWHRANFFRGQSHDHRWESWSCGPYLHLLARADDGGRVGTAEAAYFLDSVSRHPINWSELMWFFHLDVLLDRTMAGYAPRALPALPKDVKVRRENGRNVLTWSAVAGANGYRIYRAERMGGPWMWLNSPYTQEAGKAVAGTAYTDEGGQEGQVYHVTAEDAEGRESRWFADEPLPRAGR